MSDSAVEYHPVAKTDELDEEEGMEVKIGDKDLALYNVEGEFYATDGICTHEYINLCDGYVEGHIIECPLHSACFDIKTGKATTPPVTEDLKTYELKIDGEQILIGVPSDG